MYATVSNEHFFNALTGKNAELIERSLVALYGSSYGSDFAFNDEIDRNDARNIVISAIGKLNWHPEETDDTTKKDNDKATFLLAKLKRCGWIDFQLNRSKATKYFGFTKYGKKFSQILYSLQDDDIDLSRQRNVRQTKLSLEAYKEENDPQHLIDAANTSKEIISDLTDSINDVKELKNILILKAIESVDDAGENFIDFLNNKFANDVSIRLADDSVDKYQYDINMIIGEILTEDKSIFMKRTSAMNRGKYASFLEKNGSIKNILALINDRLINACETKLPTLRKEVQSYVSNGGNILKQTNSLIFNENKQLYKLAKIIKKSEDKERTLNEFANRILSPRLRVFDTNALKIKNKIKKERKDSYLEDGEKISLEGIFNSIYEKKLVEAFSYTEDEQINYVESLFAELKDKNVISSREFPVTDPKSMLLALYSIDYIASNPELYQIIKTEGIEENLYFDAEEYLIERKSK